MRGGDTFVLYGGGASNAAPAVMAGLVPAIHAVALTRPRIVSPDPRSFPLHGRTGGAAWMPGTSPGMTGAGPWAATMQTSPA